MSSVMLQINWVEEQFSGVSFWESLNETGWSVGIQKDYHLAKGAVLSSGSSPKRITAAPARLAATCMVEIGKRFLQGHERMSLFGRTTPLKNEICPEFSSLMGNKNWTRFRTFDLKLNKLNVHFHKPLKVTLPKNLCEENLALCTLSKGLTVHCFLNTSHTMQQALASAKRLVQRRGEEQLFVTPQNGRDSLRNQKNHNLVARAKKEKNKIK